MKTKGTIPVIGIRPIIDAREGMLDVRGSLEVQTMAMAKSAKKVIEENSRQSCKNEVFLLLPSF